MIIFLFFFLRLRKKRYLCIIKIGVLRGRFFFVYFDIQHFKFNLNLCCMSYVYGNNKEYYI